MKDIELIQVLWDYMKVNQEIKKSDCIIVLGTLDISVVDVAVKLYNEGYAEKIIFSGGLGKVTYKLWKETEAEKFAKRAIKLGVPKDRIYIENESTNTGDNFRFTKKLIENEKLNIHSCLIVCKPYTERRAYASFRKIMPEYKGIITSKDIECKDYYEQNKNKGIDKDEWVHVLVGDVQRMKLFAQKGWQIEVDIPDKVWDAYEELTKRGYNKYIIPVGIDSSKKILINKLDKIMKKYDKKVEKTEIIHKYIIEASKKLNIISEAEANLKSSLEISKDRLKDLIKDTDYSIDSIYCALYLWGRDNFMKKNENLESCSLDFEKEKNAYLIIITGQLAAGKTTYGKRISQKLQIPFFSKDKIKEILFDSVNDNKLEYEEKRRIGISSYDIFYNIAEELMKVRKAFILESNFVKESIPILKNLVKKYNYHTITIRFEGDLEVLHERFIKRENSNERHQGLTSNGIFDDFENFKKTADKANEFKINEQEIIVNTTDFSKVDFEKIINKIHKEIEKINKI